MSNSASSGLHITPLTMAICGVLWAVLFSLMAWNLAATVDMAKAMNSLPQQVADHEQRIRDLERMP